MSIEKDLEKVKEIFLIDEIDEETKKQNLEDITEWEKELVENKAYLEWQNSDITRMISKQAKKSYADASYTLAKRRDLTDIQRNQLFATQDACLFILSITEKDAKSNLEQLNSQIRHVLNSTKN